MLRRRLVGALLASALASATTAQGPRLEQVAALDLPEEVETASDVRWQEDGSLLVGVGANGIYSWRVGEERADLVATLAGSSLVRMGRLQDYSRLGGAASGVLSFSSFAFGIFHKDPNGTTSPKAIELVGDLDRRGPMTVAIGLSRDTDRNRDSPWESHIAWLIPDGREPHGLVPSESAHDMGWCMAAGLALIRSVANERVLVVPGFDLGVLVFGNDGRLQDSLDLRLLSAGRNCELAEPEQKFLLLEPPYFRAWLSRRRVIDEVVADDAGNVFFFVRHVPTVIPFPSGSPEPTRVTTEIEPSGEVRVLREGGFPESPARPRSRVCWDLVHAHLDDFRRVTSLPCAVEAEFADARLRADVRGERAVILLRGDTLGSVSRVPRSRILKAKLLPPARSSEE